MHQKILREERFDEESIMHFVVGLLSLGCFKQLLNFFDQLSEFLVNHPLCVDFVHLWLMVAANPELLLCQMPDYEANEILRRCLLEIVNYLKLLRSRALPAFTIYLSLFLEILANLEKQQPRFAFQPITDTLTKELFNRMSDLKLISK